MLNGFNKDMVWTIQGYSGSLMRNGNGLKITDGASWGGDIPGDDGDGGLPLGEW